MAGPREAAARRLAKDLREVSEHPLPHVVALPEESDIFTWHVNVRAEPDADSATLGVLAAVPAFHLILRFPDNYPANGPSVEVCGPLPHPNVKRGTMVVRTGPRTQRMETRWQLAIWDCMPGWKGWSGAYSVLSVLLQLQAFLLAEDLLYHDTHTHARQAALQASRFVCTYPCRHNAASNTVWPPIPSPEDLVGPPKRRAVVVARPKVLPLAMGRLDGGERGNDTPAEVRDPRKKKALEDKGGSWEGGASGGSTEGSRVLVKMQDGSVLDAATMEHVKGGGEVSEEEGVAQVVVGNGYAALAGHTEAEAEAQGASLLAKGAESIAGSETAEGTSVATADVRASLADTSAAPEAKKKQALGPAEIGKAMKKNIARRRKAAEKKAAAEAEQSKAQPKPETASLVIAQPDRAAGSEEATSDHSNAGQLGLLPSTVLSAIVERLELTSLGALSMTCQAMREACEDGATWRVLLHRHYPASSLVAATEADWKHAFLMEQTALLGQLQCFYTKATYEEDVLGFPLRYTTNPRTRAVDYIEPHFDLLSVTAFNKLSVRTNAENQKIDLLLPLYLTSENFGRAFPHIKRTLCTLSPDWRSNGYHPQMALEVLPKLLNTLAVLLCDKGLSASERALNGYCALHRLFLALCEHGNLWKTAEDQVLNFSRSESLRRKSETPSMGNFIPLLAVCQTATWRSIARVVISEVFDREVLWVCKHVPGMEKLLAAKPSQPGTPKATAEDKRLLEGWLTGSRVALRLLMFHAAFLQLVAHPPGTTLSQVAAGYDALYGHASLPVSRQFQDRVRQIVAVSTWPQFFKLVGLQCPPRAHVAAWLRQCWRSSLRKGYHRRDTDFSQVQARGLSKILLKGETFSAPPNLKRVQMLEKWRFRTERPQFLDASCLLYGAACRFLEIVDYDRTESSDGAVQHSGDVIDHQDRQGTHTISIDLKKLRPEVLELWFTMSGYVGARLSDFRLPFVRLYDESTQVDLCEYHLEENDTGTHRCVVMARLYRSSARLHHWQVEAVGSLGNGSADNYEPIRRLIASRSRT